MGTVAQAMADEAKASGAAVVVRLLDFGADGKIAKKIQDMFRAAHPDGSLFLASLDEDGYVLLLPPTGDLSPLCI